MDHQALVLPSLQQAPCVLREPWYGAKKLVAFWRPPETHRAVRHETGVLSLPRRWIVFLLDGHHHHHCRLNAVLLRVLIYWYREDIPGSSVGVYRW